MQCQTTTQAVERFLFRLHKIPSTGPAMHHLLHRARLFRKDVGNFQLIKSEEQSPYSYGPEGFAERFLFFLYAMFQSIFLCNIYIHLYAFLNSELEDVFSGMRKISMDYSCWNEIYETTGKINLFGPSKKLKHIRRIKNRPNIEKKFEL
jgi:hypothetical protein